jgi:hypothetical protein
MTVPNPYSSGNFAGTFVANAKGFVQGGYAADSLTKTKLVAVRGASIETLPFWGGLAVTEKIAAVNGGLNTVARATAYANVTGFTVNAANYTSLVTTDNTVPVAPVGTDVTILRVGSKARIYLPIDPALDLTTLQVGTAVSFDFTAGKIVAFSTTALPVKVLAVDPQGVIASYSSVTGDVTWATGAVAEVEI